MSYSLTIIVSGSSSSLISGHKKLTSHENSEASSAHQSELTKSRNNPNSGSDDAPKDIKSQSANLSLHTKNAPSDGPLLPQKLQVSHAQELRRPDSRIKRRATILPMNFGKTEPIPSHNQKFNLTKFLEDTERKNKEATQKIEGKKISKHSRKPRFPWQR